MTKISPNVIIYITVLFVFFCIHYSSRIGVIYIYDDASYFTNFVLDLFKKRNVLRVSIRSLRTLSKEGKQRYA